MLTARPPAARATGATVRGGRRFGPGERWRRLGGAFVAATLGVAVVAASALLFAAGRPQVPDRLSRAAVVAQSPTVRTPADPFPESRPWSSATAAAYAQRLAAIPGVASAVADRSFYAQPVLAGRPRPDLVEGHGWASAQLGGQRLRAGTPPRHDRDVVLDQALGLSPGDPATLLTAAGPATYTVTGVVDGPGTYLADQAAAALAPGVRAIALVLRPGADAARVADAARDVLDGDGHVLVGAARSALEPRADARTRWIGMQVLTALAALAGFVAVFVVASTFGLTVTQRRRELALLRLIGATPRQVRRMLYREALAVGGAAALLGVTLGALAAPAVGALLVDVGLEPASYRVRFVAWPIAAALTVGPVVALAGVAVAARRASRIRPLAALREATVETRPMGWPRWTVGTLVTTAGLALAVATATTGDAQDGATFALVSAMALVLGAAVLAPAVVPLLVRVLAWPMRRGGGAVGLLVREGALAAPRRTASTAAPVLLTVSFAVLVSGMVSTSTRAYAAGRAASLNAGWVLAPDGAPGLSDAAVAAVPGAALLPSTGYARGTEPLRVLGVDLPAFTRAHQRLAVRSGSLADLRGDDTVLLTERVAEQLAWQPGQRLPVTFADGESVSLRVVAVLAAESAPADLILPRPVVRAHDPSALTSAILLAEPVPPPARAGARLVDVGTYAAEVDRAEDRLVWIFTLLLIGVSAGYGAIAVANTLLMAAVNRVRDLRVLWRTGATPRQVAATVAAESALVVAIGAALGGTVAWTALLSIRAGLAEQVGAAVDLVVPWPVVGAVVALCLLLATVAAVVPARLALRRRSR